jgi:aryl-alcohol dehydrogenase-like predicted oxidoreductase
MILSSRENYCIGVSASGQQKILMKQMKYAKSNLHKPVSNQPQYNIIRAQIETNGVMAACEKYGMGEVVWSPLAQGLLSGKYSGGKIPKDSRAANDKVNHFIKDSIR